MKVSVPKVMKPPHVKTPSVKAPRMHTPKGQNHGGVHKMPSGNAWNRHNSFSF